jgi:hypothetical protein
MSLKLKDLNVNTIVIKPGSGWPGQGARSLVSWLNLGQLGSTQKN